MILLAVGTQFGFDRLVKTVDEAIRQRLIHDEVFAQIGPGGYLPRYMKHVATLEKQDFDAKLNLCEGVISHAGIGNISLALKLGKPLLVMPRLKEYGEVVNDHQLHTARKFEELGHVLAAYDESELAGKIQQLKTFVPRPRHAQPEAVAARIRAFLQELA